MVYSTPSNVNPIARAWGTLMRCEACGHANRLSAVYCGGCGRGLPPSVQCAACGAEAARGQRFCDACGQTLRTADGALTGTSAPATAFPLGPLGTSARSWAGAALIAAFAVAVFFRFYSLGDTPPFLAQESGLLDLAREIASGGWTGLVSNTLEGQILDLAYVLAPIAGAFEEVAAALRLVPAAAGLATLALLYLFCKRAFSTRAAVLATLLLAFSAWHLQFSRLVLPGVFVPLVELGAAYLLIAGLEEREDAVRQRRLLASAGVCVGLGFYLHDAQWAFAAGVALLWAREFLSGEVALETVARRAAPFGIAAVLTVLPFAAGVGADWSRAADHVRALAVTGESGFQQRNGLPEQARYVMRKVGSGAAALLWGRTANGEGYRLLDPATALLAAVGLAVALSGIWRRERFLLWAMLVSALVLFGLTAESGSSARLLAALPAMFVAAGFGLDWLLGWANGRFSVRAQTVGVVLLVAGVAWWNLAEYYGDPVGPDPSLLAAAAPKR